MVRLRWYQSEAVSAAWNYLKTQAGNPVIVAPTGSGKSHILAQLARDAVQKYHGRVIILAHRRELLEQNAEKLGMDAGFYSAGMARRDTEHDVIVAGIQSVYSRAHEFGQRQLVLIDESHLVPYDGEGMYRQFLTDLRVSNPRLRMVGLTATPYRLDVGPICRPDGMFQNVCYSVDIRRLIDEGHLCRLVSRVADSQLDTSELRVRGGEFLAGDMASAFSHVTAAACREIVAKTSGRHSVLVFCSGVRHAEEVAEELSQLTGEQASVVHGGTPPIVRHATLRDFRNRDLRWLVNCDVLTTGFDAPCIDAIAVLRATLSPGLFAQMVGRGFRVDASKNDCLVLDFGENIKRHGPIDSPDYGVDRKSGQIEPGEAPTKKCPNCEAVVLLGNRECECGFLFPPQPQEERIGVQASNESILSEPKTWDVISVSAQVWRSKKNPDGPQTMRVNYECQPVDESGDLSTEIISEWVCVEHAGFAGRKAENWWRERSGNPMPMSAGDAVDEFNRGAIARPRRITTVKEGRFYRITEAELEELVAFGADELNDWELPF